MLKDNIVLSKENFRVKMNFLQNCINFFKSLITIIHKVFKSFEIEFQFTVI